MSSKSRKKPLIRTVTVHVDDNLVAALDEANEALADAESRAGKAYDRRLSIASLPTLPPEDLLKAEDGLSQEREAALAPFREAVQQAEAAVREGAEYFVFRSVGNRRYEDLVAAHPPQDGDHERFRKTLGRPEATAPWHDATFQPALVSLACIGNAVTLAEAEALAKNPPPRDAEPAMTVEEAAELRDDWTNAEWDELFQAAFVVSRGVRQVDLGKGSRAANAPA